jgi:hypothetical protein
MLRNGKRLLHDLRKGSSTHSFDFVDSVEGFERERACVYPGALCEAYPDQGVVRFPFWARASYLTKYLFCFDLDSSCKYVDGYE